MSKPTSLNWTRLERPVREALSIVMHDATTDKRTTVARGTYIELRRLRNRLYGLSEVVFSRRGVVELGITQITARPNGIGELWVRLRDVEVDDG